MRLHPRERPSTTAHHEAAHCVVGYLLGGRIGSASLTSGTLPDGRRATYGCVKFSRWPEGAARRLTMYLAGIVGEGLVLLRNVTNDGSDADEIGKLLAEFPVNERPAARAEAERLAEDLLLKNWPAVDALAKALQERGTLAGEEVESLLSRYKVRS